MKLQVTKYLAIELTEPNELLELVHPDDMVDFTQSLSCRDEVVKHVADQIIHGFTEFGYHAGISQVESEPSTALQKAVREVSLKSSDIAKQEIESLQRALANAEKQKDEYMNKYYDLYHGRC